MIKVGLILYSVRDRMAIDPLATVEEVAKLGYKNIEVCNHNAIKDFGCGFGLSAEDMKAKFDEYGSRVVSAHIFPYEKTNLHEIVKYNAILGNKNIVNPNDRFTTYDELMKTCEFYNESARILWEEGGMKMLYHNHTQEYRTFGGKSILDIMMENTDPTYVGLELDTFWTMRAGKDPVEMLKHFGKRVRLVHQKDFAWDALEPINQIGLKPEDYEIGPGEAYGTNGDTFFAPRPEPTEEQKQAAYRRSTCFTEIGDGIMNIQAIIDTANEYCESEYIILEQDATRLPTSLASIERSMESFRKFNNISWDN